jgi:benzodiazapine receptor
LVHGGRHSTGYTHVISVVMKLFLFFILNFGALALGSYLMGEGPMGSWYTHLNKAPWTPPGWVFGAAWTLVMVCLSIFMNKALQFEALRTSILWIYGIQLALNILWNPLFFNLHWTGLALIEIITLVFVVGFMALKAKPYLPQATWLLTPYVAWLCIAITLNAYALQNN